MEKEEKEIGFLTQSIKMKATKRVLNDLSVICNFLSKNKLTKDLKIYNEGNEKYLVYNYDRSAYTNDSLFYLI